MPNADHIPGMSDLGDFENYDPDDAGDGGDTGADDAGAGENDFEEVPASPVGSDRGIGTLSASEGLVISEEADDTCLRAYVTVQNRSSVRIGSYLVASYPDGERLFCRIVALEYAQEFRSDDATEIHARRAMRLTDIDEQDYKFMATLEPVAVLYSDGGDLKRRTTVSGFGTRSVIRRLRSPPSEYSTATGSSVAMNL